MTWGGVGGWVGYLRHVGQYSIILVYQRSRSIDKARRSALSIIGSPCGYIPPGYRPAFGYPAGEEGHGGDVY